MKRISCKNTKVKTSVHTILPGDLFTLNTALAYCILEPLTEYRAMHS